MDGAFCIKPTGVLFTPTWWAFCMEIIGKAVLQDGKTDSKTTAVLR